MSVESVTLTSQMATMSNVNCGLEGCPISSSKNANFVLINSSYYFSFSFLYCSDAYLILFYNILPIDISHNVFTRYPSSDKNILKGILENSFYMTC